MGDNFAAPRVFSDSGLVGLIAFDSNGTILNANKRLLMMLDYNEQTVADAKWQTLTPSEYHRVDEEKLKELGQTGTCRPWRKELITRNGNRIPVFVQIAGETKGCFTALILDVSQFEDTGLERPMLPGQLLKLYDDERRIIARELHDTTAQNLAALAMNLAMLSDIVGDAERPRALLAECASLTEECLKEVRSLSYKLHPPLLEELGLESALRAFLGLYERQSGVHVDLYLSGLPRRQPPELELGVFRIVQESLFNVHAHSGSERAEVRILGSATTLELVIRDWGRGIQPAALERSFGIAGMRERARLLSGQFEIGPATPGTVVRAIFPME